MPQQVKLIEREAGGGSRPTTMRRIQYALMTLVVAFMATQAFADSAATYLSVSLHVVPNCRIAITDLAFGAYDPLLSHADTPLDATADLQMLCTKNSQANVVFDFGRNSHGPVRGMIAGAERVNYELFQDASRNKPWGDGENALHVIGSGGREAQRFVVYGRVPAGQEVPPGPYTDIVMATVDF